MANELANLNDTQLMQNLQTLGTEFAKSGILGVSTPSQGLIVALTCYTEHISPIEFARTYHIVGGRLTMRADAMQAQFLRHGGRIRWLVSTNEVCEAIFTHSEYAPNGVTLKLTIEEMVDSGVAVDSRGQLKQTWKTFPRQMLRARIVSEGCRMLMPGIVAGVYTPEEAGDFSSVPTRTLDLSNTVHETPVQALPEPDVTQNQSEKLNQDLEGTLLDHEETVNLYLKHIKWLINDNQTWRNLSSGQKKKIEARLDSFIAKAKSYVSSLEEEQNVLNTPKEFENLSEAKEEQ
ncbi:MAG: recombinase RecT [Oscillospiraceae bacterium]|nr:recombinase RecT [Oscillospiraceae bacterium]